MSCTIANGVYICDGFKDVTEFDFLTTGIDFTAPTPEEVSLVEVGDYLEVNHIGERFWTMVVDIDRCDFIARVEDDLEFIHPFIKGDLIKFNKYNVYTVRKV